MKFVNVPSFFSILMVFFLISCAGNQNINSNSSEDQAFQEILPSDSNELTTLKAALNTSYYMPGNADNELYLYLEVKTKALNLNNHIRKPLNLSLVIDKSGSMNGDKLDNVKNAAKFIIDNLRSTDFISIVSYDNEVVTDWASGNIKNKEAIKSKIDLLIDKGGTNLSGGLLTGYEQVKSTFKQGFTNRVLLLTDGLANKGITDPSALNEIVRINNIENSISLSTFGVGVDYNEDLLQSMAENAGGNYYYIESAEKIPEIFKQELDGLLQIVAQNTKLNISLPKGISINQVFGFKSEVVDSYLQIYFRDLTADDVKGVLIKMALSKEQKHALSFETKLTYTKAIEDYKNCELMVNVALQPSFDSSQITAHKSKKVEQWVTFYESNYQLEKAMFQADKGNYDEARKILNSNKIYMESRSYNWGFNASASKTLIENKNYDSVVVDMEKMNDDKKVHFQKDFKNKVYRLKLRKKE